MNLEAKMILEKLSVFGTVEVFDPGDNSWSTALIEDLDACDEVSLRIVSKDKLVVGVIGLVWGNEPGEAISDYSESWQLEKVTRDIWDAFEWKR